MVSNQPVTLLTFMVLFVVALGSHSQSSYQILTKSGGSPSDRDGLQFDDPPIPRAGDNAVGFDLHLRRAALSDPRPLWPCDRLRRRRLALAPVGSSFGGSERIIRHVQVHDQQAEVGPTAHRIEGVLGPAGVDVAEAFGNTLTNINDSENLSDVNLD
jgi:hypothetical protein